MGAISQGIGAIASILGIGSSLFMQGIIAHREFNRPDPNAMAQMQQQCQPPKYRLEVVVTPNGQRQLVCTEVANVQ